MGHLLSRRYEWTFGSIGKERRKEEQGKDGMQGKGKLRKYIDEMDQIRVFMRQGYHSNQLFPIVALEVLVSTALIDRASSKNYDLRRGVVPPHEHE